MEALAKVFFCGSTSSPRTEKLNNLNLSPFTLSLSKGKLRTFARSSLFTEFTEIQKFPLMFPQPWGTRLLDFLNPIPYPPGPMEKTPPDDDSRKSLCGEGQGKNNLDL